MSLMSLELILNEMELIHSKKQRLNHKPFLPKVKIQYQKLYSHIALHKDLYLIL